MWIMPKQFLFPFLFITLGRHPRPFFLITPAGTLMTLLLDWGEGAVILFPLFPAIPLVSTLLPRVITQCQCVSHCLSPLSPPPPQCLPHSLSVCLCLSLSLSHDISAHFKSLHLHLSICSHSSAHESSEQISLWSFSPRAWLFHPTDGEADVGS